MHRWWHTKQLADNRIIMGKPSVLFRKVVNTRVGDEIIAVNAQQYAVLVMDVPNLHKENDRCVLLWPCQTLTVCMLPAPYVHCLKWNATAAHASASFQALSLWEGGAMSDHQPISAAQRCLEEHCVLDAMKHQ